MATATQLHRIDFNWLNKLSELRRTPAGKKVYLEILEVFKLDHVNLSKNVWEDVERSQKIKCKRVYHPGWIRWQRIKYPKSKNVHMDKTMTSLFLNRPDGPFGRYQYIYSSTKGVFSLTKIKKYSFSFDYVDECWEICPYDYPHLIDIGKFKYKTKRQAERKIRKLLK